jgi:RimJ/RimL family protein N-acetyltransferase
MQIQNENDLVKYVEQAIEARSQKKEYPFIVFDKKKQQYAGSTRFYGIELQFQTLQLGYTWYGSEFQGTHVNPNCKLLLLEYAFEKLNMERVEFRADNRNARSIQAMKNLGCIEEGILRNHLPTIDGGRRDSIILRKNQEVGIT